MLVVSCVMNEGPKNPNPNEGKDTASLEQEAQSRADVFTIQRAIEDEVLLSFGAGDLIRLVSLKPNECIYVSSKRFKELKISTGEKLLNLCGYASACAEGNFKIVKGSKYNKRESTEKLSNCSFPNL